MKESKKAFGTWKQYVKHLIKNHPEKNLKWILQVYHKNHKAEWEEFKKNPKSCV